MSDTASEYSQAIIKPRVMVVDDEEFVRASVRELLSLEGIDVLTAFGSGECLHLLRSGFQGVILMDVNMPGKDGWATIREIENAGLLRGNIICMLTASGEPDKRMDGLQEIIIDYIDKPFEPAHLIASVRKYLELANQLDGDN